MSLLLVCFNLLMVVCLVVLQIGGLIFFDLPHIHFRCDWPYKKQDWFFNLDKQIVVFYCCRYSEWKGKSCTTEQTEFIANCVAPRCSVTFVHHHSKQIQLETKISMNYASTFLRLIEVGKQIIMVSLTIA